MPTLLSTLPCFAPSAARSGSRTRVAERTGPQIALAPPHRIGPDLGPSGTQEQLPRLWTDGMMRCHWSYCRQVQAGQGTGGYPRPAEETHYRDKCIALLQFRHSSEVFV
uniref:Uncharacterized protein n=1 Tax=Knipowitschia caucasica TaxID=637954 RepID=A0AAV2JR83_KNICA